MSIFNRYSICTAGLGATASLLLLTGTASAQTSGQTKTESFNVYTTAQNLAASNLVAVPGFNSSLGTLEGINLTLSGSGTAVTPTSQTTTAGYGRSDTLQGFKGNKLGLPSLTFSNNSATSSSTTQTQGSGGNSVAVNSSLFDLLETPGSNTVNLNLADVNLTSQITNHDNGIAIGVGAWSQHAVQNEVVTVQYTYLSSTSSSGGGNPAAVPEPAGKYLSGIVAAGMALLFLRRKKLN
jgi:hypothetical protein